jgi:hypothetical protein
MAESVLYRLSIALVVLAGTAGFTLGLLACQQFRGTPFGNGLFVVAVFCAGFTGYHVTLLVAPELHHVIAPLKTASFLTLVGFVWLMLRMHRRMGGSTHRGPPQ